jgi:4-carboxymuconolactone decarboxylase
MRLPILDPATLDDAQRKARDAAISGKRGRMPPPAEMWLYSPELANRAQSLGEFIRFDTSLGAAMAELAILVTARHWTSQYEWYAHKRLALAAATGARPPSPMTARRPSTTMRRRCTAMR